MSKNTLQMRLNFQKRYPVIRNYYYCSRKILRSIASLQDKLLYRLNSVWNSIGRSSWTTSDLFWVYIVDTGHTKKTNKSLHPRRLQYLYEHIFVPKTVLMLDIYFALAYCIYFPRIRKDLQGEKELQQ